MGLSHGLDKRKGKSQLSEKEAENLRTFQDSLQPRLEKLIENLEENQEFKNAVTEEERVAIVKNNNALSNTVEEMQEIVHKTMTMHAKDLILFGDDFQILSKLGKGGEGKFMGFISGLFLGSLIGVFIMCLLIVAGSIDDDK